MYILKTNKSFSIIIGANHKYANQSIPFKCLAMLSKPLKIQSKPSSSKLKTSKLEIGKTVFLGYRNATHFILDSTNFHCTS